LTTPRPTPIGGDRTGGERKQSNRHLLAANLCPIVEVLNVSVGVLNVSVGVENVSVEVLNVSVEVLNVSVEVENVSVGVLNVSVEVENVSVEVLNLSVEVLNGCGLAFCAPRDALRKYNLPDFLTQPYSLRWRLGYKSVNPTYCSLRDVRFIGCIPLSQGRSIWLAPRCANGESICKLMS